VALLHRLLLISALLLGAAVLPTGCGSSSTTKSSTRSDVAPASRADPGVRVTSALMSSRTKPRISAASCSTASAREAAHGPFGRTKDPVFGCTITRDGAVGRYVVQLLPNGCVVAESVSGHHAIYGCDRS
jgi:hypothetical protein